MKIDMTQYSFLKKCQTGFKVVSIIYIMILILYFVVSLIKSGPVSLYQNFATYLVAIISIIFLRAMVEIIRLLLLKSSELDHLKQKIADIENRLDV